MAMDVVKLGKKGQVSIPAAILKKLGLEGGRHLIVELADDGAIVLRPAGIYPIEIYAEERIAEFLGKRTRSIPSWTSGSRPARPPLSAGLPRRQRAVLGRLCGRGDAARCSAWPAGRVRAARRRATR